jgi:hypothetical protein
MNHTPGPWKADGYHVRQAGTTGTRIIADVCYTGPHHTPPEEYPKSCRLADEANARLIAASPELLATISTLINLHDGTADGGQGITDADWNEARAIVAKISDT